MTVEPAKSSLAEQIAAWADMLRDLSATGLKYANNPYDQGRYEHLQKMAMEMTALSTGMTLETLEPLRLTYFSRMSPVVAGTAAVIDTDGKILLMLRSDNNLWAMPGGQMEVGETPAEAVVRETYEETGVRCFPTAMVGIYDSRKLEGPSVQQVYKFTFLCSPLNRENSDPFDPRETREIGWFSPDALPKNLYKGHFQRISDAYQIQAGTRLAHFDWE